VQRSRVLAVLLAAVFWGSPAAMSAALAAVPKVAVQGRLDTALADYAAGRMAASRAAFEGLARQRLPVAEYNLAVMQLRREVPKPDRALARRLLTRAAESGFVTAQFMLAQGLENG